MLCLAALLPGGCFTGVESTPRITDTEVRRRNADTRTPEERFMSDLRPRTPSQWARGKQWRVADNKFRILLTSASERVPETPAGDTLLLLETRRAASIDGRGDVELMLGLTSDPDARLYYRTGMTPEAFVASERLDIPFTVDLDLVRQSADSIARLPGTLYIVSPRWYTPADGTGHAEVCAGLRHVPVEVDSVGAGDNNFPIAVYFHTTASDAEDIYRGPRMVYMTVGSERTATRNFSTLFAFDNPRTKYPEITDPEIWDLIIHSKVRRGMTRQECRLALGAPTTLERIPTTAGTAEHWSYSDGVYLLFNEEGILERFRL